MGEPSRQAQGDPPARARAVHDRIARIRGAQALNELRDDAQAIAPALGAERQLAELDECTRSLTATAAWHAP
jgi:hypothetical protein